MAPNDITSEFSKSIFIFSSSESSDSESFLEEDIKSCGSQLNKQWEAIERTLYQEPGQQVTDPELLRECKLWRETFPHFRVKGTKLDLKKQDENDEDKNKSVQTHHNHLNLTKLNEKREHIKKKVVGELVERLISKFNLNKNSSILENFDIPAAQNGAFNHLSNQDQNISFKKINKVINSSSNDNNNKEKEFFVTSSEKESYYERGKLANNEESSEITKEEMEKKLFNIFNSWEQVEEQTIAKSPSKTSNKGKIPNVSPKQKQSAKSGIEKLKLNRRPPPPDSLANIAKPFEMTKKIDKKYEGLLEKIMERRYFEMNSITTNSKEAGDTKSYRETLEKLRMGSEFEDSFKRNLPRINKFSNPWLDRSVLNSYYQEGPLRQNKSALPNYLKKSREEEIIANKIDRKFVEELKKDSHKRPANKGGVIEEINLRRPKPFRPKELKDKTQKSFSCGDLPKRNNNASGKQFKSNVEADLKSTKIRSKNFSSAKRNKGPKNGNGLFPPIESGIICTELTGRPKIGSCKPFGKR